MTEAQFKVGDRVRIKDTWNQPHLNKGYEFTITAVKGAYSLGDTYQYNADISGWVWNYNLELVEPPVVNESLEFMKSWITDNLETYEKELTEIPYDSKTYHYTLGIIHSYRDVLQSIDEELEEQK